MSLSRYKFIRQKVKVASTKQLHIYLKAIHFVNSVCTIFSSKSQTGSSSPNLSKLAKADISCQIMKTRSLCRTVYSMCGLYTNNGFSKAKNPLETMKDKTIWAFQTVQQFDKQIFLLHRISNRPVHTKVGSCGKKNFSA